MVAKNSRRRGEGVEPHPRDRAILKFRKSPEIYSTTTSRVIQSPRILTASRGSRTPGNFTSAEAEGAPSPRVPPPFLFSPRRGVPGRVIYPMSEASRFPRPWPARWPLIKRVAAF